MCIVPISYHCTFAATNLFNTILKCVVMHSVHQLCTHPPLYYIFCIEFYILVQCMEANTCNVMCRCDTIII